MSRGEVKKADRKKIYWNRLVSLLDEYHKILIVAADNVGSNHMQKIRSAMRGKAVLLMGKNVSLLPVKFKIITNETRTDHDQESHS